MCSASSDSKELLESYHESAKSDASTAESLSSPRKPSFVNNCSHFVKMYTFFSPEIYLGLVLGTMHFFEYLEQINNTILIFILDKLGFLDIL